MSVKTFLERIWLWVKNLFEKLPKPMQAAIRIGVVVTEQIKNFTDSGVADILTAIIPGELDDNIKKILRKELPRILVNLKLADKCGNMKDPNQIVKCAISTLQNVSKDYEKPFLHALAIMIAQVAADGKLSWSDGVYVLQWYYEHIHKQHQDSQ
jgi:hypothetical protein